MTRELNSLLIYGASGTGKTTTVAMAMPRALWVVTRKSNLSGYHSFIRQHPELAQEMNLEPVPQERIIQVPYKEIDPANGRMRDVDVRSYIDNIVASYCLNTTSGKLKVDGIVFDEFSVFAKRVYGQMRAVESNGFKVIDDIKRWTQELCEIPVVVDKPMAMICHAQDPKFEDGSAKPKYKGGPAMPIGTMIAEVCALPDAVLHQEVVMADMLSDDVKRVFKTQAHPHWERKCRLWGVEPEIEADLRKLLQQAGWDLAGAA